MRTATFFSDYYTNWVVQNEKATGALDYIFGAYDYVYLERKPDKFMEVHYDAVFGKKQGPPYVRVLSFIPAVFKARSSNLYDTFNEGVGPKSNRRFIRAGQIYRMRKGLKLYTYKFVRGYAKGWGYDLR